MTFSIGWRCAEKKLVDKITMSSTDSTTMSFKKKGKFEPLETVQEKYKDQPELLETVLANAPTHKCDVTQKILYWTPEYYMEASEENERKRHAERSGRGM